MAAGFQFYFRADWAQDSGGLAGWDLRLKNRSSSSRLPQLARRASGGSTSCTALKQQRGPYYNSMARTTYCVLLRLLLLLTANCALHTAYSVQLVKLEPCNQQLRNVQLWEQTTATTNYVLHLLQHLLLHLRQHPWPLLRRKPRGEVWSNYNSQASPPGLSTSSLASWPRATN